MPLYIPRYHNRQNPFGQLEEITPPDSENLFASKGTLGGNPRLRVQGQDNIQYYFGTQETSPNPELYHWISQDNGGTWKQNVHPFPANTVINQGFIDSRFTDPHMYFAVPFDDNPANPNERAILRTYETFDNGTGWDLGWELNMRTVTGRPDAFINAHRIFPTSNGIFQAVNVSTDIDVRLLGFKDGTLIHNENKPLFGAFFGIATSAFSTQFERGYFNFGFSTNNGGDEIYRVDAGGLTKTGALPSGSPRPFLLEMFYVPRIDTLLAYTVPLQGARIYRSFNEGVDVEEYGIDGGFRINVADMINYHRRGVLEQLTLQNPETGLGKTFRSHSLFDDATEGLEYDQIIQAINNEEPRRWQFGFPTKLYRRYSKMLLWQLLND